MSPVNEGTRSAVRAGMWRPVTALLLTGLLLTLVACSDHKQAVTVGLITKQEVNPYWVTMRKVAEDTAEDLDVTLVTATGTSDVDVDSQRRALEKMIADKVGGVLIAPTDSKALLPDIKAAREQGMLVIAVDTPFNPEDAVNANFATDNAFAGRLVGQYAKVTSAEMDIEPKIVMLDLAPGISSGEARHQGFLGGFGIKNDKDPAIVAMADTEGDRKLSEARMLEILDEHPDVNIIYTVNEPAALGALAALKDANVDLDETILVSIDGGCRAIKNAVRPGDIDATAMQFPQNMAREGVRALAKALRGGDKPSGFFDTGVKLITGTKPPGVDAEDIAYGVRNCWGE